MEEATMKRQYRAESSLKKSSSIFVFLQSFIGESAAGMFKFNIHLITNNNTNTNINNNNNNNKAPSVAVVVSTAEEPEQEQDNDYCLGVLSPMKDFFNRDPDKDVSTFTHCQFPPHELYLFPDDTDIPYRSLPPPCLFNLKTNTTTTLPFSLERKWQPIAAAIDKEIYVLATGTRTDSPEPRFEAYHPILCEWTYLPNFPFSGCGNYVSGHAVLNDRFLLVCLNFYGFKEESEFYSFNTRSALWKRVKQQPPPPPDDSSESASNAKIYPTLFGQGIVLFEDGAPATCGADATCRGVIYSYCSLFAKLLAFSYTDETINLRGSVDHDITLGPVSLVEGFQVTGKATMYDDGAPIDHESGAIAKLDHNIFCLLHTDPHFSMEPVLNVSGFVIQIHDDNFKSCTILKNFTCAFTRGDLLRGAHIQSCLALQLEEQKDDLTSEKETDCSSASTDDEEMED